MGQFITFEEYMDTDDYIEGTRGFFNDFILSHFNNLERENKGLLELEIPYWATKITNKSIYNYFLSNRFKVDCSSGIMHITKKNIDYYVNLIPVKYPEE